MTERQIIALIKKYSANFNNLGEWNKLSQYSPQQMPGDDAAYFLTPPNLSQNQKQNLKTVVTTDSVIENNHFDFRFSSMNDVAEKLFQKTVSDLIVKGVLPAYVLLNFNINSKRINDSQIKAFFQTLFALCKRHKVVLIGGDCAFSPNCVFSMTAIGFTQNFIGRKSDKIKPGDKIYLLGQCGKSLMGLLSYQNNIKGLSPVILKGYRRPQAQWEFLNLPSAISGKIKASMDQSDSLHECLQILSAENQIALKIYCGSFHFDTAFQKSAQRLYQKINFAGLDFAEEEHSHSSVESLTFFQILLTLFSGEDHAIVFIADDELPQYSKKYSKNLLCLGEVTQTKCRSRLEYYYEGRPITSKLKNFEKQYLFEHFKK